MVKSGIAVKSFIVNNNKEVLIVKRDDRDPHSPGFWEFPGGRLNEGENPFEGLKRETKEETNLSIDVLNPLKVHHFTRDDGQIITLISFLCKPLTTSILLSEEHSEFEWCLLDEAISKVHPAFQDEINLFKKYFNSV